MAAKLTPSLFQIRPHWVQRWEPPMGGCATPKEASSPSRACTRATWRRPPLVRSLQSQPERRRKIGSFWRSTPYWWVRGWRSRDVWWRRLGGHRKVVICEALLHLSGHEELWIIVTIISYCNSARRSVLSTLFFTTWFSKANLPRFEPVHCWHYFNFKRKTFHSFSYQL